MRVVIEESAEYKLMFHRASQGSGIMMLTDLEITEVFELGAKAKAEVCLFIGSRSSWDI